MLLGLRIKTMYYMFKMGFFDIWKSFYIKLGRKKANLGRLSYENLYRNYIIYLAQVLGTKNLCIKCIFFLFYWILHQSRKFLSKYEQHFSDSVDLDLRKKNQ